jgi:hypothetical protein
MLEILRAPIEEGTIPFGMYRGQTLDAVLYNWPDYLLWLLLQRWAWRNHPDLCRAIVARGPELLAAVMAKGEKEATHGSRDL